MTIDPRELSALEQKVYAAAFGAASVHYGIGSAARLAAEQAVEMLRQELRARDSERPPEEEPVA